ncbi:uncharacterized protein RJT21DRAFT_122121 [Scheffersomyces amazonensis]|uniref:uncharacterized protein n=1 Tax=Scheffersomyces amazonensis TaxID=1078765 RepID=UPI00315CB1B4
MSRESSPNYSPSPSLSFNQNLSKLSKDDIIKRDIFGRTILHLLILCNRYDLLRNLLKNNEIKSLLNLVDYENGWNCLHYCIYFKRLICFNILIEFYKNCSKINLSISNNNLLMECLRYKDRNGVAPIQLLGNDFKDLKWIPQYINEKNEFHIAYRFGTPIEGSNDIKNDVIVNTNNTNNNNNNNNNNENIPNKKRDSNRISQISWNPKRGGSEIYSFGSNSNNQLGVGDSRDRSLPTKISHDIFKFKTNETDSIQGALKKPRYKQFSISKNHSLIITHEGELYSSGIGSRGRLGHGFNDVNDSFKFKKIEFFNNANLSIREVAISNNHSIALTTDNKVYAWGLNSFHQLGIESETSIKYNQTKGFLETFESIPTLVQGDLKKNYNHIIGICVSKVHSVAYTKNEIFFWGLNIGQMGIPSIKGNVEVKLSDQTFKGEIQNFPKLVQLRDEIKSIDTNELCTCVVTIKNDIHIYYNYQHFKLPKIPTSSNSDKHFDIFIPTKLTQAVGIKKVVTRSINYCALLLENGSVLSFSINNINDIKNIKYSSVWKGYDHDMLATDIDVSSDGSIVLCTRNGSVFLKSSVSSQRKNSMSSASYLPSTQSKFKRIDNLNKIVKVSCDINFLSFGFIRDDIDILPLKLQKNDFFKDIEYLCPLIDSSSIRKQHQLLQVNHKFHTYISNFLYPNDSLINELIDDDDNEDTLIDNESDIIQFDLLKVQYDDKFDRNRMKREKLINTLDTESESESLIGLLQSDLPYLLQKFNKNNHLINDSGKSYDCYIKLKHYPDTIIGVHKHILEVRSRIFFKILNPEHEGDYFISESYKVTYDSINNIIEFHNDLRFESILLLVYAVYTSKKIDIWSGFTSRQTYPPHLKQIFQEYSDLLSIFQISNSFGSEFTIEQYMESFKSILDKDSGDVIVKLNDGFIRCHSYILKARSAFFETVLSTRWDNELESKQLDFTGLTKFQFNIILRHLYGYNDFELFDCFGYDFYDQDEFINDILELIEISDELLLFQLKSLCQLAIIDFISLDNVMVLLIHADYLSAPKLFMNCCWYIYNNLEILLFDSSIKDLSLDVLKKLEHQINYFQNCKILDFANEKGELNQEMLINSFEIDSNGLLTTFLNDINSFNEYFISDRKGCLAFEPLIDCKFEIKKVSKDPIKKKKSRKSSNLTNDILNFRETISKQKGPQIISPIAIDDNDGFEVVSNKQRRKSKASTSTATSTATSIVSSPSPTPPNSIPPSRSSSVVNGMNSSISTKPPLDPIPITKPIKVSGLSPFSNWASKNSSGSPILNEKFQPILGKPAEITTNGDWNKKTLKAKIGPVVKLSQKERKRLAASSLEDPQSQSQSESSKISGNPWAKQVTQTINVGTNLNDLPVLGSSSSSTPIAPKLKPINNGKSSNSSSMMSRKGSSSSTGGVGSSIQFSSVASVNGNVRLDAEFNKVYSTPSLTEVMIQESLRLERVKLEESQRKTLSEIQQEEEFAKWWAEESKKVQKQMGLNKEDNNNKPKSSNRKKSNSNNTTSSKNGNESHGKKSKSHTTKKDKKPATESVSC